MPDFESLYPGRFLNGKALDGPKTIRILGVAATDLEGEDGVKAKCVVKYASADGHGEIVWCKTNAQLAAAIFAERDYTKWIGKLLTIHFDPTVRMGAEVVGGIRVCGSPELQSPREIQIRRPRRKRPEVYVVHPTDQHGRRREGPARSSTGATRPAPQPPGPDHGAPSPTDAHRLGVEDALTVPCP
jgi:hypothetical protein